MRKKKFIKEIKPKQLKNNNTNEWVRTEEIIQLFTNTTQSMLRISELI